MSKLLKETTEQALLNAFLAGFAISREGFNGECAYEHCADSISERSISDTNEALIDASKNETVLRWFDCFLCRQIREYSDQHRL